MFPSLEGASACDPTNPCSLIWVRELGLITIPSMALSAFALVVVLLSIRPPASSASDTEPAVAELAGRSS
jgi:hypothetical protein